MSRRAGPRRIGVVADDLTGATDTAVELTRHGYDTLVLLRDDAPVEVSDRPTVLAMSTAGRGLDAEAASRATRRAVATFLDRGVDELYLKVDSVGRGPLAGILAGARRALAARGDDRRIAFCPALPQHGRHVVAGHLHVDGAPVTASAAATDPVSPVADSDLLRRIPGAVSADLATLPDADGDVVVVDAESEDDLALLAERLEELSDRFVPAGSSGLAAALASLWAEPRDSPLGAPDLRSVRPTTGPARILVAVSSLHPASAAQVGALRSAPAAEGVHVITVPDGPSTPAAAARRLAEEVAHAHATDPACALVLVGGDGAAAALEALGAQALRIVDAPQPGAAAALVVGGAADGIPVITKSGGFGDSQSLVAIVDRIRSGPTPEKDIP